MGDREQGEACEGDLVAIVPGRNVWVLARTDRDAPDMADVIDSAGAFLSRALGDASPSGTRGVFEPLSPQGTEAEGRYIIGAARPVLVTAVQARNSQEALARMPIPPGKIIGKLSDCATTRAVTADAPWFVTAAFDWRGPRTTAPWPRRAVSDLGFPVDRDVGLDWLLLSASSDGQSKTSDSSIVKEATAATRKAIGSALGGLRMIAFGAVVAGGLALIVRHKLRKRGARGARRGRRAA